MAHGLLVLTLYFFTLFGSRFFVPRAWPFQDGCLPTPSRPMLPDELCFFVYPVLFAALSTSFLWRMVFPAPGVFFVELPPPSPRASRLASLAALKVQQPLRFSGTVILDFPFQLFFFFPQVFVALQAAFVFPCCTSSGQNNPVVFLVLFPSSVDFPFSFGVRLFLPGKGLSLSFLPPLCEKAPVNRVPSPRPSRIVPLSTP